MGQTTCTLAPRQPGLVKLVADVMTPNPQSIRADALLEEAVAFLVDTGYSAAPVIDDAGRPIGVISRSDIVVHDHEQLMLPASVPTYFESGDLDAEPRAVTGRSVRVEQLMTPAVFVVTPDATVQEAAAQLVALNVHRLFVVDEGGTLIGVVSVLDLLRHLLPGADADE
jgi:CBS domain-containing protein